MKILKNTKTAKSLYSDSKNKSGGKAYLLTFLLLCSIGVILYLSMLTLSAHQLHHSLQRISADGNYSISVERLDFYSDKRSELDAKRQGQKAELEHFEDKIFDKEEALKDIKLELSRLKGRMRVQVEPDVLRDLETEFGFLQPILDSSEEDLLNDKCELVQKVIDIDNDYISSLDSLFQETGLGATKTNSLSDNSIHLALGGYVSLYDKLTLDESCTFTEIRRNFASSIADKQLTQMLAEFRYFNAEDPGLFKYDNWQKRAYVKMPRSMLTILVVLFMGALGGLITLVRALMSSGNHEIEVGIRAFLFTPLLGSVTAFAIFVLAKAGVLIVSDAGSEGGAYLSPFFVSFLGLISGLLSIDALDTITNIAKRWFVGSAKNIERWYTGSADLLEDADVISILAVLAEAPDQDVKDWLSGDKATPYNGQTVIAAAMKMQRGAIFTDIKP